MITGSSKYNKMVYSSVFNDSYYKIAVGACTSKQISSDHSTQSSSKHVGEQPSSGSTLPSSHSSPALSILSPQTGLHTDSTEVPSGSSKDPL